MRRLFVLALALLMAASLFACGKPAASPTPDAALTSPPQATPEAFQTPAQSLYFGLDGMTEFETDELGEIYVSGMIPDSWTGRNLNEPVPGSELHDLWRAFSIETLGIPEGELDAEFWVWLEGETKGKESVQRGAVGMLYVFGFLKSQLDLADFDSFDACMDYNTNRDSLYCAQLSEHLDARFDEYRAANGGAVWGGVLCTLTKDRISGAPLFDVDEEGYARLTDPITYKEALQMLYRFSRSNRWGEAIQGTLPFEEASTAIFLTEEQQAMAAAMPTPSYENLPDWQGLWMTGDHDEDYTFEEDFRTLAELGFNHLRYTVFIGDLLSDDRAQFNALPLKAVDDAIAYGLKYGVHISLNIKVSERDEDVFVNWQNYGFLADMYRALAARYADVPSSALSFYLFFEPPVNDEYAAADKNRFITDARYAEICYELADAIWAADAERFITADGMHFGWRPSLALAQEGARRTAEDSAGLGTISQSFHFFSTDVTWTNGFYGEKPSLASWPMPYVQNALYAGGQTITLNGNSRGFPAGTRITLMQSANATSPEKIELDTDCEREYDGADVTFILNGNAESIVFSSSARNNAYNEIETVWIEYAFDAAAPIPVYGYFTDRSSARLYNEEVGGDYANFNANALPSLLNGMPLEAMLGTLVRRFETKQIVVIPCGGDMQSMEPWGSASTAVTVAEDYTYTSDSAWDFGADYTRAFLAPWRALEETYHTQVMLTEFAVSHSATQAITAAIINQNLDVMREYGIPWGGYAFTGTCSSAFDGYMFDGDYRQRRTRRYEAVQMEAFQSHMTTFEVSEVDRQAYTGDALTPEIAVSLSGKALVEGMDYMLSYFDNTDYGCASVRILGAGDYAGMVRTVCFTISPFDENFAPAA